MLWKGAIFDLLANKRGNHSPSPFLAEEELL